MRSVERDSGPRWQETEIARLLDTPGTALFTDRGASAGFLLLRMAGDEAEVIDLGVLAARRRLGIGQTLLSAGEAWLQENGIRRLLLEVDIANAPARALYARAGFAEAGRRRNYYRTPNGGRSDALILAKALKTTDPAR